MNNLLVVKNHHHDLECRAGALDGEKEIFEANFLKVGAKAGAGEPVTAT
jgi:hypothetical protein